MRVLKWIAILCGSLLALAMLAAVALALFIDPNAYKPDIEQWVAKETGRPLTLQGDLSWSFFPWLAVRVGPAQLGERADQPQFGNQPFVSLQGARLSVKLMPLLGGRIEVGRVELLSPSVRLITDERGRHNYDDLTASSDAQANAPPTEGGGFAGSVGGVSISNGQLILDDRRAGTQLTLSKLELAANGIESGKPFDLRSSFVLTQSDAPPNDAQLSAQVTADWVQKRYTLGKFDGRFQLRFKDGPADGVGATLRADVFDMDLARQSLRLTGLSAELGGAKLSGELIGNEVLDAPAFTGKIALAAVSPRELAPKFKVSLPVTRDPDVLKRLSFASDVSLTPSAIALSDMQLQLDDSTVRGSFAIANLETNALRFDVDVDRIDFDRYLPPAESAPASGPAADSAPTPIPVDLLRALNVRGELRVGDAKFSGLKLSKLRMGLNARDGDVRVTPAQAALYGGAYEGDVALNVAAKQPRLALNAKVANVQFAPLLKDMLDTQRISGRGAFNANLTAVGADTHAMLKTLGGNLDFNVADGAYEGMDLWYEIRRARALIKQQPIPERVGAERTLFTAIKGTGAVRDGVMSNQDLIVAMQYLTVDGKGTVDLAQSAMDYRFIAKVLRIPPEGTEGSEMADLVDAEIPITAKGPLASPKVRPDVEGYLKTRAKQELKKETDKLQEKAQQKLQEKLQNLLRR